MRKMNASDVHPPRLPLSRNASSTPVRPLRVPLFPGNAPSWPSPRPPPTPRAPRPRAHHEEPFLAARDPRMHIPSFWRS